MWLTGLGVERAGLGGIRAVKSPPAPTTIGHAVLVGWSAARAERRGRTWKSARELALEGERWEVPTRCERGFAAQLPDLAVWLKPLGPPWAVIAESGGRREDRQKLILEGWREAVHAERYAGVRYDCASASVARWISRLATKVLLTAPAFSVIVQTTAEEIAALARADAEADELATSTSAAAATAVPADVEQAPIAPHRAPLAPAGQFVERSVPPALDPETPEAAAERYRRYRQIFGIPEPKPRRRWRR